MNNKGEGRTPFHFLLPWNAHEELEVRLKRQNFHRGLDLKILQELKRATYPYDQQFPHTLNKHNLKESVHCVFSHLFWKLSV